MAAPCSVRPAGWPLASVVGHRGAAAHAPENTLAGLRRARELGCDWVEFDVRLTADGVPVLCHDARLDRTTSGSGRIAELPLAAVRACDAAGRFAPTFAGERVPTLDEALALAAELGLGTNIEIKSDRGRQYATVAAVAEVLRVAPRRPSGVLVSSFDRAIVADCGRLMPLVSRGVLFGVVPRDWAALAARLGATVIGVDQRRLRRRQAAVIRGAGYGLAVYTVNDPARARLLFGWGVTSVFSDIPDIIGAISVVRRKVYPLEAPSTRQGAAW